MATFQLDFAHTNIGFTVRHMMVSKVRGTFRTYRGTLDIDPTDFTKSTFAGEIEVASIDTGNTDRDAHLRNNDFFDAPNHPLITFASTGIQQKGDDTFEVTGDLTIRGVTKPISLAVEYNGINKNPWGQTVVGFNAHAVINRTDFGVNFNAALETGGVLVGEKVNLDLDVEGILAAD